ncbi:MAG: hypothetical protein ACR2RA_12750 [Geminicoccaceae bacterium]
MMRAIVIGGLLVLALFALAATKPLAPMECLRNAIYDDAILHAGSTDYVFLLESGVSLTLRMPNGESASAAADALIAVQEDGPAEASQERLGRAHDLCYDDGRVEISLSAAEKAD